MLSNRGRYNVDIFMPTIAAKVDQKVSTTIKKIDLATAENWLMRDELVTMFKTAVSRELVSTDLSYVSGFTGDPKLVATLATFFNSHFQPHIPVEPSHIVTGAGAGTMLDSLLFNICNPGDGMLVIAPYWNGFDFYFTVRPSIRMIPVNTTSFEDCFSRRLITHLREAFDAENAKSPIKGVVLCNPHNPLGRCYPKSVLAECLRFCQEKDIHFVSDEIYALSVFDAPDHTEAVAFESVLSLDLDVVGCDRSRVHAIWSMSKDFGCSGLRMGCVVSQDNKDLTVALALAASNQMSSLTALTVNSVLSTPRCQMKKFIETNQSRLGRSYCEITTFFRRHSIPYFPCNAGLYVWARLGGDTIQTVEEENALWVKLNEHGVGVSAGSGYHAAEAGWFRITFAVPENILSDALRKIELALGLRPPSSYSSEFVDLESGKEMVVTSADQRGMLGLLRKAGDVLLTRVKGYLGYKPWSLAT